MDWVGLGALSVLTVASQNMAIDIYDRGKISISAVLILAGGILWGMPGVLVLALVVGLATRVLPALTYYVVNAGLLSVVMGIGERTSPTSIWNERFRWLFLHYLTYEVLALAIAVSYQAIGLYGLLVFFVPTVMSRYVMKQYTD